MFLDGPRVALLSSRDVIRYGLRAMLTGVARGVRFTYHLDASIPADVVVLDATGTADADAEELQRVTAATAAPVVVLTSGVTAEGFTEWEQPVFAFVTVAATADEVVHTVARALEAGRRGQAGRELASSPPASASGLSPRELEVLAAIAAGRSNVEIAEALYLGVNTVKTYIRTAYRKIGVVSRSQAVIWALDHGLGVDGVGGRTGSEEPSVWSGDGLKGLR